MPCNQDKILRIMNIKLKNEISMLTQISSVLTKPNIKLIHPFLFCNFIEFTKKIPLFYKIRDQNDLLRKTYNSQDCLSNWNPKNFCL